MIRIGLDIGSTTVKAAVLDDNDNVIYENYRRHMSRITEMSAQMLREIREKIGEAEAKLALQVRQPWDSQNNADSNSFREYMQQEYL